MSQKIYECLLFSKIHIVIFFAERNLLYDNMILKFQVYHARGRNNRSYCPRDSAEQI